MYLLEERERKKKVVIKRKEDVPAAKVHLRDLLQTLANVWENKKVAVNVDDFKNCFNFNDIYANNDLDQVINKIQVILIFSSSCSIIYSRYS